MDHRFQRMINHSSNPHGHEQRPSSFNGPGQSPRNAGFSYAPGPRYATQQLPSYDQPGRSSTFSNTIRPGLRFYDSVQPYFDSARPAYSAPHASPARLSLPPPRGLDTSYQSEREPRVISNAENHFRFTQNLRHGVPLQQPSQPSQPSQAPMTHRLSLQQPDGINQLADAMLKGSQYPIVDLAPATMDQFHPMQPRLPNPLQPQKQQITPPFNLAGFVHRPEDRQGDKTSSSPYGHASSPTTRVSFRRAAHRTASRVNNDDILSQDEFDEYTNEPQPQTPAQQMMSQGHRHLQTSFDTTHFDQGSGNAIQGPNSPRAISLAHAPPIAHGIQLVSPYELSDRIRQVFPFQLFNAVQSKCFEPIYKTNDNIVVSSPTGSGKTALLELAICKIVEGHASGQFKIVYQAPTKSLCSERMRDWNKKFSHLNLACAELTGDTSQTEMAKVRSASIIVTTPEKWDSITRKWADHHKLVQMVKLFLIDEVHILKDPRGATLEAVVSRMKSIGADVRFVALSATVPNSEDIAVWLGRDHTNPQVPAHRETFGESFRPVKLQKHVYGFECNTNDYVFDKVLDGKLTSLIKKHSIKKPIMVFCLTRKSCENTAVLLADWWNGQRIGDRAWPPPTQRTVVGSKELKDLVSSGVAFHHAGLDPQDRHAIENAFLKGDISVICCTSTLAVGVNLPCHLVVLKGTVCYQDSVLSECSDLEVMQMLGRAGRPQFDDSAVAIIMTKTVHQQRYEKMISGQDILESTLHLNLIEHLNSEIGLGTVNSLYKAKTWLSGTFLAVRMRRNPDHYKLNGIAGSGDTDERLERVCERDIKLLQQNELITAGDRISCTEYGEAMSRYMVSFETMKHLLSIPKGSRGKEILDILCQASEFEDIRMKSSQKICLREYNKSAFIKFPIHESAATTAHKISLLIQAQLGGVEHPDGKDFGILRRQFTMEKTVIFERIQRLIRCVIDCKAFECDSVAMRSALDLARSFSAQFWEHSNLQLRQIPQIGPVAMQKLIENNIRTVDDLSRLEPATIERYMSKNPPFGRKIQESVSGFPRLQIKSEITGRVPTKYGQKPKIKIKAVLSYLNTKIPVWNGTRPSLTFLSETIHDSDGILVHFWRGSVQKLERGFELNFIAEIPSINHDIKCWLACDNIVGTLQSTKLKHEIPAYDFAPSLKEVEAPKQRITIGNAVSDDEFGDDIDDDDLLTAAIQVQQSKFGSGDGSDGFVDVDDYDHTPKASSARITTVDSASAPHLEPYKMGNGKWTCNHACRDGNVTKNGQICKHRCCKEGLEKPVKPKRKPPIIATQASEVSNQKVDKGLTKQQANEDRASAKPIKSKVEASKTKLNYNSTIWDENHDVHIVDLADDATPTSYSDFAPRDFRKLNALHNSIAQKRPSNISLRPPRQKALPESASDKDAQLLFGTTTVDEENVYGSEDDLPSPSKIFEPFNKQQTLDPFETPPAEKDNFGGYQDEDPFSSILDDSLESLEAGMIGLADSMELRKSPRESDSTFVRSIFDFDGYNKDSGEIPLPVSKLDLKPATKQAPKRSRSPEPIDPVSELETKYPRVESLEDAQESSLPTWVSDFDPELIESLRDIVEFVE